MPLTNANLEPTPEWQHPRLCPGMHSRSRNVLHCGCHDESRVALLVGGHQVDVRFFREHDHVFKQQFEQTFPLHPARILRVLFATQNCKNVSRL